MSELTPRSSARPRVRAWVCAALLVLLVMVVHGRDVFHAFVEWDDVALVVLNHMLNPVTPGGVLGVWIHPTTQAWTGALNTSNIYTPIAYTLWAVVAMIARVDTPDAHGGTLNPLPFHLLNLLLHAGCVLMVFDILRSLLPLSEEERAASGKRGRTGVSGETLVDSDRPTADTRGRPLTSDDSSAAIDRSSSIETIPTRSAFPLRAEITCAIAAALFAVHPMQVEPVAWVAGMNNLLAGLFSLACVAMYVRFLAASRGGRARRHGAVQMTVLKVRVIDVDRDAARFYVVSLVMLLLAFLSKPTAIVTPLMLFAIDALLLRRPLRRVATHLWPLAAVAIPFVIIGRLAQPVGTTIAPPLLQRFVVGGDAIGFYLQKLLWPHPLLMDYSRTPQWLLAGGGTASVWLSLAVGAVAILAAARWQRWILAPAGVFLAGISIVLGFLPFDYQLYSTVADRYVYLAMLGPAIFTAIGLAKLRRPAVTLVASIIVCMFAVVSFRQTAVWQDTISLCSYTVDHNPRSLSAYVSLGTAYRGRGETALAELNYRRALEIRPTDRVTNYNYGNLLLHTDPAGAIRHYQIARDDGYDSPGLILNTGTAWITLGQIDKAIDEFQTVLKIDPGNVQARINLGNIMGMRGDLDSAERYFQSALQIDKASVLAARGLEKVRAARAGQQ